MRSRSWITQGILICLLTCPGSSIGVPTCVGASPPQDWKREATEELRDAARAAYEGASIDLVVGTGAAHRAPESLENVYQWSCRWMNAERALSTKPDQEARAARDHLTRMRELAKGARWHTDHRKVDYYLTEAEMLLAAVNPKENESYQRIRRDRARFQCLWKMQSEAVGGKPSNGEGEERLTVRGHRMMGGFLTLDPVNMKLAVTGMDDDVSIHRTGTYQFSGDTLTIEWDTGRTSVYRRAAWDSERLRGQWTVVSAEQSGKGLAAEVGDTWSISGKQDSITITVKRQATGRQEEEQRVSLHEFAKPKEFAWELPGSTSAAGIYDLQGDELKWCHSQEGKKRPVDFSTKANDGRTLFVLKRSAPKTRASFKETSGHAVRR